MTLSSLYKIPKTFSLWIVKYISNPIEGFNHKTNFDGSYYDFEQQKNATLIQLSFIVNDMLKRDKDAQEILDTLAAFRK